MYWEGTLQFLKVCQTLSMTETYITIYIYIYVYPMLILRGDSFSTLLHKELPAILIKFLVAVPDLYKMKETDPGAFSQ